LHAKGEVSTGFLWGNLTEKGCLKNLGVDGRIILKINPKYIWWISTGA
jgi:hypothetical protein